jgi:hypothetical protein
MDTVYRQRPPDSHSKLHTIPDGIKIFKFIVRLIKEFRPAAFFGLCGMVLAMLALLARFDFYAPLKSLITPDGALGVVIGLVVATVMAFGAGPILDSVSRGRRDVKRMMYLGVSGPAPGPVAAPSPVAAPNPVAAASPHDIDSEQIRLRSNDRS